MTSMTCRSFPSLFALPLSSFMTTGSVGVPNSQGGEEINFKARGVPGRDHPRWQDEYKTLVEYRAASKNTSEETACLVANLRTPSKGCWCASICRLVTGLPVFSASDWLGLSLG